MLRCRREPGPPGLPQAMSTPVEVYFCLHFLCTRVTVWHSCRPDWWWLGKGSNAGQRWVVCGVSMWGHCGAGVDSPDMPNGVVLLMTPQCVPCGCCHCTLGLACPMEPMSQFIFLQYNNLFPTIPPRGVTSTCLYRFHFVVNTLDT